MAKLGIVPTQKGGGGGFGAADTSDDLVDMTNYEKAILKPEIFKMLGQLTVIPADKKARKDYVYLKLDASDIPDLTAASMGAAGHAINSEFAALRMPFRAIPYSSEDAVKVEKVAKRGKNAGKAKKVKETDCLKIYRTGDEFDPALYAVDGGDEGSIYEEFGLKTNDEEVVLTYENFTVGQKLRADKWLGETDIDPVLLEDMGIVLQEAEEEEEEQ